MVESSGGSCRCACQEDFHPHHPEDEEGGPGCCSPHVFTSVLLGILSCVLMMGGVFLAFHRWDPMWLMVSGVGVVLILIGTVLHCCNNMSQRPSKRHHPPGGKGCCRPLPDHHPMPNNNNGSLTEQLLPLSNARSVSQLSLNMLPGYFPPVVTAYGIEQHSAVVQNINRLVQQQQLQQQQQQPQNSTGSCSPGVASTSGKSFIVLSLPADATSANIQNLVATVYQLDGNSAESTANEVTSNGPTPVTIIKPNSPVPLILKNAEVQTCNIWPVAVAATTGASTSGENSVVSRSSSTDDSAGPVAIQTSASIGATQTDDIPPVAVETINLMDCSPDISPICDNSANSCDNPPADNSNSALVDIPSPPDLLDVSAPDAAENSNSVLLDIPEAAGENVSAPSTATTTTFLLDVVVSTPPNTRSEILLDISANPVIDVNSNSTLLDDLVSGSVEVAEGATAAPVASTSDTLVDLPQSVPENMNSNLQSLNAELLSSTDNLSTTETDIDDGELMDRSSPPPSYEDVTLEGENVGAFGLAYGTI